MSDSPFDASVQDDVERVKQLNRDPLTPAQIIEYSLWTLAIISVVLMLVVMPWVGSDKLIPGQMWLGYSLLGILLFTALAVSVRLLNSHHGQNLDNGVRNTMERRR